MKFEFFDTDFYQLSMVYVYIMEDKANTIAGFEGFIRHIKQKEVKTNYLSFEGREEIIMYMNTIQEEFKSPEFVNEFVNLISTKIPNFNEMEFRNKCAQLNFYFEWDVIKTNDKIFPHVPVFQFRGPIWIGQIIETSVTNSYNGRTGLNSLQEASDFLRNIVHNDGGESLEKYISNIKKTATEFKKVAGDIPLFEAALRRSANKDIGYIASKIAIDAGFTATSNTAVRDIISMDKIGGSMAHAFVMFFETELQAFKVWNKYFSNGTILIDTYDTINAVKMLIENNIKPSDVRIDSGDLFKITIQVRKILNDAGWFDVGIFVSGDVSIEMIRKFKEDNTPVDKIMVGTKLIYTDDEISSINAGFVYKIVEVHDENEIRYPEKKSIGKKSYSGIKHFQKKSDNNVYLRTKKKSESIDLSFVNEITENDNFVITTD